MVYKMKGSVTLGAVAKGHATYVSNRRHTSQRFIALPNSFLRYIGLNVKQNIHKIANILRYYLSLFIIRRYAIIC